MKVTMIFELLFVISILFGFCVEASEHKKCSAKLLCEVDQCCLGTSDRHDLSFPQKKGRCTSRGFTGDSCIVDNVEVSKTVFNGTCPCHTGYQCIGNGTYDRTGREHGICELINNRKRIAIPGK